MRVTKTRLPIHFMPGKGRSSCGENAYAAGGSTLGSRDVRDVTCSRCMGTDEFKGGVLAQRNLWRKEDNPEGLSVPEKVAVGEVRSAMSEVIGLLELHLAMVDQRDQEIDDLEHALDFIPWWHLKTRRPIAAKLKRLRTERGY